MELRDKIIKTAGDLFVKEGIRQVTMDKIANVLGISKRTLYENFKDKNDLLRSFLLDGTLSMKKQTLEIIKDAENVIDALFRFGEFNRNLIETINPLFFKDIRKYHKNIAKELLNDHSIKNHEISYTLLKRGVNEGVFVKWIDIELANEFIHYVMDFFHSKDRCSKEEHVKFWRTVYLPYLKGICTDKGLALLDSFLAKRENYKTK